LKVPNWHAVVVSAFPYGDKIPEITNLKRGKIYFSPQFQRLHSMGGWPYCFWACGKGNVWLRRLFTSWQPEGKEKETGFQGLDLPLGPTS
jgi:hypothetical protein